MPIYEAVFKVTHDCPFANISRKFPSLKMFVWCNREHEVIEIIVENRKIYSDVMREISKLGGIVEVSSDRHNAHFITKNCLCNLENSVGRNIDEYDILHVSPVIYDGGWEYYRVIVFRHKDLNRLLQQLDSKGFVVNVLRVVPFDGFVASSLTLTADALFSDLTQKQIDALLSAYSYGYYQFPKKADVKTIASRKGVPRTTLQEHLTKGENKIIASLVPYIKLFERASEEKRKRLKIK